MEEKLTPDKLESIPAADTMPKPESVLPAKSISNMDVPTRLLIGAERTKYVTARSGFVPEGDDSVQISEKVMSHTKLQMAA